MQKGVNSQQLLKHFQKKAVSNLLYLSTPFTFASKYVEFQEEACYSVEKVLRDIPRLAYPQYGRRKMLFQARVWHLVSDFATPPRMQQSILSSCGDQSYFMHNSQTTVTRFVPNLHVSPSADTEVPRLTSLAMLLHHLAKSSRIRGILTKPFTIRHFSPSVLLTTPNYGVICRRLWYYQDFKVHLVGLRRTPFFGIQKRVTCSALLFSRIKDNRLLNLLLTNHFRQFSDNLILSLLALSLFRLKANPLKVF